MPDGSKNGACQSSGTISGIIFEIPNMMPDDWLRNPLVVVLRKPSVGHHSMSGIIFGISEAITEMVPDNCQTPVLGLSGTSFGILCLFLGYKKESKWCNEYCFGVFKGVLELPYVNICYIRSHSNHENHPFKTPKNSYNIPTEIMKNKLKMFTKNVS